MFTWSHEENMFWLEGLPFFAIYNNRVSRLKCDQIGGNGAI